jgi:hypothetical protein
VCTFGVDRCAYVHACGVNRRACVRTYGLNSRALEERLTGVKRICWMLFMVHVADIGIFYVAIGDLFA